MNLENFTQRNLLQSLHMHDVRVVMGHTYDSPNINVKGNLRFSSDKDGHHLLQLADGLVVFQERDISHIELRDIDGKPMDMMIVLRFPE